jgi:uncharacterized protein with FMN-binding domain
MELQPTAPKKSLAVPAIVIAAVLVVVAALAFGGPNDEGKGTEPVAVVQEQDAPVTQPVTEPATPTDTTPVATASSYKDGTYTKVGEYSAPSGQEKMGVTVTIKGGVITAASLEHMAVSPISANFQTKFEGGYKTLVVGKRVDEVQLDKVSGSSLTPKGFNDALAKIKLEAKA